MGGARPVAGASRAEVPVHGGVRPLRPGSVREGRLEVLRVGAVEGPEEVREADSGAGEDGAQEERLLDEVGGLSLGLDGASSAHAYVTLSRARLLGFRMKGAPGPDFAVARLRVMRFLPGQLESFLSLMDRDRPHASSLLKRNALEMAPDWERAWLGDRKARRDLLRWA